MSRQRKQDQKQQPEKVYWKDALRALQQEKADATNTTASDARNQKWTGAFWQATEEVMDDTRAVVHIPDEARRVIERTQSVALSPSGTRQRPRRRLSLAAALLGVVALLVPLAISYFNAYRRILRGTTGNHI